VTKPFLEKIGSIGAVVAAAACPVCFPKLALIGALFGLGAFGAYESQIFVAAQALASGAAVFAGLYWIGSEWLAYAGFAGLVIASVADLWPPIRGKQAGGT